jgi:flagellar biosynthesis GTPase FlhF
MNNLFRKSNFQNQFRDVTTVMLVVQEIQIAIDDGRGNQIQQEIFAQSVVVANRGARETQTVMVFDSRKLIAQDILGNNAFQNIGQFNGVAGATGAVRNDIPTKTQGVQLFGAKPTWTAVAEDPAAALGGIWEQNIQDLQKNDNDAADIQLNAEIAKQEAQALKDAQQQDQGQDQEAQKAEDEAKKAEEEQAKKAEEEAKKAEEEQAKKAEEEAKKAEEEQAKKAEEEAKKAQDEQAKKAEEEQKKAQDEAKKAQEEQAKAAEQPKRA